MRFNSGDKVEHITGGPEMAVEYYAGGYTDGKTNVVCSWFDEQGINKVATFNENVLKKLN